MKKFECTIKDPLGIHARTAALLAKEAGNHSCRITIEADGACVEVGDLVGVMCLGVTCGQKIAMECEGLDEDRAAEQFQRIFDI